MAAGRARHHAQVRVLVSLKRLKTRAQSCFGFVLFYALTTSVFRTQALEPFLPRQATLRAALRRQGSSRKLQAAWRSFCAQRQTTRALAQAFAATGVPFT